MSKYRPAMPILTLVIPQLKTESMKWKLEGRAVARQCQISRSLFPVLAAPSPSGQSSFFQCPPPLPALLLLLLSLLLSCPFAPSSCPSSSPSSILSLLLSPPSSSQPGFGSAPCCCLYSSFLDLLCDARAMPNLINKAQSAVLHCLSAKPEAVSGGTHRKRQNC